MARIKNSEIWNTSIAISLLLSKNKKYSYKVIPLKYENHVVKLNKEDDIFQERFKYAISILKDKKYYLREIERECIEYFEHYYYDYYIQNAVKMDGTIDYAFLWHNVSIEFQVFMTRRALTELMYIDSDKRGQVIHESL